MNEQNHVPTILAVSCQKGGEGKQHLLGTSGPH